MPHPQLLPRLAPHERGRFYLTSLTFMCVATGALVSRSVGDALFLSGLGSDPLPFMYMGGALLTGMGAYACARASSRHSTARVSVVVGSILALANLCIFLTLDLLPVTSRVAAYLTADIAGRLPVLLFWGFANEIFDARESRRLFGLIGAAGTAACLPAGLLVGPLAEHFGTAAGTLVVGVLLTGSILAVTALDRREAPGAEPGRRTLVPASARSSGHLHRNGTFISISALAAVTALVQTLVDYQFKATYAPLSGDAALAALFGTLYATTSVAALLIQLFLVHRILQRAGVLGSLALMPAAIMAASAVVLRAGSSAWVFATKAVDVTLTITVNGTARQLLYRGIRSQSRLQARALAEGLYQPLAVGLAGAVLALAMGAVTVRAAAMAIIVGCILWLLIARASYISYVGGLLASIRGRRFEADEEEAFTATEPALEAYVRETLESGPDREVIYLVEVLPHLGDFTSTPELEAALRREDPRVKVAVLEYLRENGPGVVASHLESLARHEDPQVRRAAIRCACTGGQDGEPGWLRGCLEDSDPRARAAAAAALAGSQIPEHADAGRASFQEMVESDSPTVRAAAAEGLADAGPAGITPLLSRLLTSSEDLVVQATLEACGRHPDTALVPAILPALARRRLAALAADALVAVGPAALGPLTSAMEAAARRADASTARKLSEVLGRIGDPRALPVIRRAITWMTPMDRPAAFRAFSRLTRRRHPVHPCQEEVGEMIGSELRAAHARTDTLHRLGPGNELELARCALIEMIGAHLRNAFILLDLCVDNVDMMALHSTLGHGTREGRSQALELLQNVLPEAFRSQLLSLLDRSRTPAARAADQPSSAVAPLLADPDSDWLVAGAILAATRLRARETLPAIRDLLEHPEPVVRETALWSLSELEERAAFMDSCAPMREDPDPRVRDLARLLSR